MPALSIRQPHAEAILLEKKKFEYRTVKTNRRGRVYIYASRTLADDRWFRKYGLLKKKKELRTGVIVGTVEIVDCTGEKGDYEWKLRNPKRLQRPIKPTNRPQPVWFKPFESS
jgi:hypothetical protein